MQVISVETMYTYLASHEIVWRLRVINFYRLSIFNGIRYDIFVSDVPDNKIVAALI